ncbi:MAG: flavodoxin family protein [Endomicrobiaceae bacterium]|nr:flavodoxin family protein [Endomicrobiaceae bacterium]
MKVVAFNCSPRKDGNTSILINTVFKELEKQNIETKQIQFGAQKVSGCIACYQCVKNKDKKCIIKDDIINDCIAEMDKADGIILGSPVYFANVTPIAASLICRAGMVARANDSLFAKKIGAGVVAVRRAGALHAFNSINNFFTILEMIVVGSNYWNMGFGKQPGDVNNDEEGLKIMSKLGENMGWLLKKLGDK